MAKDGKINLKITEQAHSLLLNYGNKNESFSDVIIRIIKNLGEKDGSSKTSSGNTN